MPAAVNVHVLSIALAVNDRSLMSSIGNRKIVISNATPQPVNAEVMNGERIVKTLEEAHRQCVEWEKTLAANQKGQHNTTGQIASHEIDVTESKEEVVFDKVRLVTYPCTRVGCVRWSCCALHVVYVHILPLVHTQCVTDILLLIYTLCHTAS
jgi:hypothetical protein